MTDLATEERGAERPTSAQRLMNEEDDRSLSEWIAGLDAGTAIRCQIHRKSPTTGPGGENVAGLLDTVDEPVDETMIKETWGGGNFQIKIFRPNGKGNFVYFKAKSIKIAGEPKMAGRALGTPPAAIAIGGGNDDATERAMSAMERLQQRSEAKLDRLEAEGRRSGGLDMDALQVLLAPIQLQLAAAQEEARELRNQLVAASNRPPPTDPFRDRMLEKMTAGEEARVETLRATYEARIEKLRDSHADDIKHERRRAEEDIRRLEKLHDQALANVREGTQGRMEGSKLGYEGRIDSLKSENAKLERELAALTTRLAALEAKKDQSLTDKASELIQVREALEGLGGGADKEESVLEKAISALGSSEAVLALINKIGAGPAQQQLPPPGTPFQGPDGQIYVVGPDGQPALLPPRQRAALAARRRKARPAAAQPAASSTAVDDGLGLEDDDQPAPASPAEKTPDAKDVKLAIVFMEGALANGTPPATLAATARTIVPADVLRYIQRVGIDGLLDVALDPGSPLNDQLGRNYAREVARALLGS